MYPLHGRAIRFPLARRGSAAALDSHVAPLFLRVALCERLDSSYDTDSEPQSSGSGIRRFQHVQKRSFTDMLRTHVQKLGRNGFGHGIIFVHPLRTHNQTYDTCFCLRPR
jgi:hypothetical protein